VVTEAWVGGQHVAAGRFNGAGSAEPLVLAPRGNSLAVEFAALDYNVPDRNLYAYRLDGFDHDWIHRDSNRRLAAYTNLPPGRYTLRLRGASPAGDWTAGELRLPIQVMPAWYQTLWFKVVLTGLIVAAALWLVQVRTAWLRRRQRDLETQIAERTRALATTSDRLKTANAELEAVNAELARLAHHDPLTGLLNRRRFFELAADEVARARRHGRPCSVFMIDLDHFKRINDTYGHSAGDAMLRAVARRLLETVREIDFVARMGGEELAVLLPETGAPTALAVAERVRQALASLAIPHEGGVIRVTASIGVAAWRETELDVEAALHRADAALYRVKTRGRNGVALEGPAAPD
jgi:diguanylate cyclase (GGDEF)-like protein